MSIDLPEPIETDLPRLLADPRKLRFELVGYEYNHQAFGNYYIEITDHVINLRIVGDRGQYCVEGPAHEHRAAGLRRAFDSKTQFEIQLLGWLYRLVRY